MVVFDPNHPNLNSHARASRLATNQSGCLPAFPGGYCVLILEAFTRLCLINHFSHALCFIRRLLNLFVLCPDSVIGLGHVWTRLRAGRYFYPDHFASPHSNLYNNSFFHPPVILDPVFW